MVKSLFNSIIGKFKGNSEVAAAADTAEVRRPAPKKDNDYKKIVDEIDRMISVGEVLNIRKKEQGLNVYYYLGEKKIIDVCKTGQPTKTIFLFSGANHLAREMNASGLKAINKNEARSKGYGPAKALYTGTDPEIIKNMLKAAR
ncbi:hypothetical protein DCCM_3694 [Desulfocucumis palustris]|uniref:Uncharacterized protein n=1 Tax=Desulfocucumis palustris TaxID=1898651 RepID=A0A2L2XEB4_9FIRM|nr:hypothetical protein [Desulfocucumis palustris]GBF34575.1 hypothetical protein DCCM_3694 [Desulfocucumis palustris]